MAERVVLLSIPQLRMRDVTPGGLSSLERVARRGSVTDLAPPFPGLAACAFTTLITGAAPRRHGVLGNTYFDRETRRVMTAPLPDAIVQSPRIWTRLREQSAGARTMLWFPPDHVGAEVDLGAWLTPEGTVITQPAGLAQELEQRFGPFPLGKPGGEHPRLEATAWMLRTASAVLKDHEPTLAILRIPYLGQVARRHGPDGRHAGRSVRELETHLGPLLASLPKQVDVIAATESVVTTVGEPIRPNLVLRELGLLALKPSPNGGQEVDLDESAAWALADHQLCHIQINDPSQAAAVAAAFAGDASEGIACVASHKQRARLGLEHPRAGDVILIAEPDTWFAPDWWQGRRDRPTRDTSGLIRMHGGVPLDPSQVGGSLGAPSPGPDYLGVLVTSAPPLPHPPISLHEIAPMILNPGR